MEGEEYGSGYICGSSNKQWSEFKANNLHAMLYFFQGDFVRHKNTGATGIVSKIAGDEYEDDYYYEYEEEEEEEDDEGNYEDEGEGDDGAVGESQDNWKSGMVIGNEGADNYKKCFIQTGKIVVKWMDCYTEPIQDVNDVTLLDRPLHYGHCVASDSNPSGEIGIVTEVNIFVDLLAQDGSIMKNISTSNLSRVKDLTVYDPVLFGSWFGVIKSVRDNVTVLFDDGSQYKFEKVDPKYLLPVSTTDFEDDVFFPYYQGQRVTVDFMLSFENSWWKPSWRKKSLSQATVIKVEVVSVIIDWISCSSSINGRDSLTPDEEQSPINLKRLSAIKFDRKEWELGQRCLLSQSSSSTINDPMEPFEKPLLIVSSRTTVDVEWQSGAIERGRDSKTLILKELWSDQEFYNGEYVLEKVIDGDGGDARRHGFVISVNVEEKTASVRWLNPVSSAEAEIVSIYELETHPEYKYWYCSVVFRRKKASVWDSSGESEQQNSPNAVKQEMNVTEFSSVGMITELTNGCLEVAWGDNTVSMVGPHEVYEIPVFESFDYESEDGEDIDPFFWCERRICRWIFRSAVKIFTKATTFFSWRWEKCDESNIACFPAEEDTGTVEKTDEITARDGASSLKRFDTAKDPCDHHFRGKDEQVNRSKKWFKKVHQDWSILQNSLPDGIYVRIYEDRMDLIRAVIVGAYGTPYQDGIFFFDFYLPPEYPDVPPVAYYNSGGWKINQNLYEEGSVCLSLLNTWEGEGTEVWNPTFSNILQVLVSFQALVLNEKPYFNEAGYDTKVGVAEEEKHSLSYNENVFLLNCKTMMYLIRKPPKDFDEFVHVHFKKRGYYILKACDAYLNGHAIGSLDKDACVSTDVYAANSTSVGFRIGLKRIASKLYSTLLEIGADCSDFAHLSNT